MDKAEEMGIDWWETDPALSSRAHRDDLARENVALRAHRAELERGRSGEGAPWTVAGARRAPPRSATAPSERNEPS